MTFENPTHKFEKVYKYIEIYRRYTHMEGMYSHVFLFFLCLVLTVLVMLFKNIVLTCCKAILRVFCVFSHTFCYMLMKCQ